jgi:hypothetical protein
MRGRQLWLFPPPRPLVERFGDSFFRQVPARPGVYYLCGRREGVLYLGKAKNLRKRLGSYRVANPERLPRRMIRLLFQVERIEWDVCSDEATAAQREKALLRVLQPKFNRANLYPPARVYLGDFARRVSVPISDAASQFTTARKADVDTLHSVAGWTSFGSATP